MAAFKVLVGLDAWNAMRAEIESEAKAPANDEKEA
jgi:hypothetical protein